MAKLNHYMAFLRVAVDEYDAVKFAGRVYSQRLREPLLFSNTAALLLQIEELLDEQDFPRAFQRKRTFGMPQQISSHFSSPDEEEGENMDEETVSQAIGAVSTFALNVITRQNTSWQGYLDWLDGSSRVAFNSDLELLSMIINRFQPE